MAIVNRDKLRGAMVENHYTISTLAKKLNIIPRTLTRKINETYFNEDDIEILVKLFGVRILNYEELRKNSPKN